MKTLWIVVANSSVAKIFTKKGSSLEAIKLLNHPESRLHNRDLVSDKPGRDFESASDARHAFESKTSPHQVEVQSFAREVADFLNKAKAKNEFDDLYMAASPIMLGKLREEASKELIKSMAAEIDKDCTTMDIEQIMEQFTFSYI